MLNLPFSNYSGWLVGWLGGNTARLKPASYAELDKNMTFASLKEEEYHFILPSQYKYDFLDGYPRGRLASICSQFQNCLKSIQGGGGICPKFSTFKV